jgi:hypothetical protein
MPVNAQYNVAAADSLPVRIAGHQRKKMYRAFLSSGVAPADTVLDIGVTSDQTYDHSNYLEFWYPYPDRITALGIDEEARFLEARFPGIKFVAGDGRLLPFRENAFDYVHSSAVLEHVGSRLNQAQFIAEACRVARKGVFLTTPNRWFPIEFHTVLPVVHWLPPRTFRRLLRALGKGFFAEESNLNLLSAKQLHKIAQRIDIGGPYALSNVRLCGLASNLLFIAKIAKPGR